MADILVVEDEPILAKNVCESLRLAGHHATSVSDGDLAFQHVDLDPPALIVLDLHLPHTSGMDVLKTLRGQGINIPVIVVTAHGSVDIAVEAMKAGAADFLTKPLDLKELNVVAERVLERQRVVDDLEYFRHREQTKSGVATILGESPAIQDVRAMIVKVCRLPALAGRYPPSVLITGETGTGKDLVARAIHYEGPRKECPFVHVNCIAMPEQVFESEVFGHMKGAFTGANSNKKGLLEVADGGTVFLDEIGHLSLPLQAKLLTAIERKVVRPVGATTERSVDVHLIAATNRELDAVATRGEFRADLYHRLKVLRVTLPPLRERGADIGLLGRHFAKRYAARFQMPTHELSDDVVQRLHHYDWPGNVRELAHVMENAVLMSDGRPLSREHFRTIASAQAPSSNRGLGEAAQVVIDFETEQSALDDLERELIVKAMEHTGESLTRAGRLLGLTREAVRYRMNKHRDTDA